MWSISAARAKISVHIYGFSFRQDVGYVVDLSLLRCARIDLRTKQDRGWCRLNQSAVPVYLLQLASKAFKHRLHESMRATRAWIHATNAWIPSKQAAASIQALQTGWACINPCLVLCAGQRKYTNEREDLLVYPAPCWCDKNTDTRPALARDTH